MDNPTFPTLSARTGIDLPKPWVRLLDGGKTEYGPAWRETWRERCLQDPPALISCFDFEWIGAARSGEVIEGWLNPGFQSGRVFLPFAESGAGDSYCLVPHGARRVGVALIRHDHDEGRIDHLSFSDFLCAQFLGVFADLGGLLGEEGFTQAEALEIVRADVRQVAACLDTAARDYLLPFCELEPVNRPFSDGPRSRPRQVFSLISQEQLADEMRRFPSPGVAPFPVVERWRIPRGGDPRSAPAAVDWETLALDPAKKMQAIRAYQAVHAVDLATAKAAVQAHAARPKAA